MESSGSDPLSKLTQWVRGGADKSAQASDARGYNPQALKALMERKRQNDAVRRHEFEALRSLRNQNSRMAAQAQRDLLQSVSAEIEGRAITLKKINEIEAQMSKMWWKHKPDPSPASPAPSRPASPTSTDSPAPTVAPQPVPLPGVSAVQSTLYAHTQLHVPTTQHLSSLRTQAFAAPSTVFDRTTLHLSHASSTQHLAAGPATQHLPSAHLDTTHLLSIVPTEWEAACEGATLPAGEEPGLVFPHLFAAELEAVATDPELEEAAMCFAKGDDAGAQACLLAALRSGDLQPASALSWVAALLDLYRATQRQAEFERAVSEFAWLLDGLQPVWKPTFFASAPAVSAPQPSVWTPAEVATVVWAGELRGGEALHRSTQAVLGQPQHWEVDCSALVRVDFAAAGDILNWAVQQQGLGATVQFNHLHRLVAAFFNTIGIHAHAKVLLLPL